MTILFNNPKITTWIILAVTVPSLSMVANAACIVTNLDIQWRNNSTEFRALYTMSQYGRNVTPKTSWKYTPEKVWCEVGPWIKQVGAVSISYDKPRKIIMSGIDQTTNKERYKMVPITKEAQRASTNNNDAVLNNTVNQKEPNISGLCIEKDPSGGATIVQYAPKGGIGSDANRINERTGINSDIIKAFEREKAKSVHSSSDWIDDFSSRYGVPVLDESEVNGFGSSGVTIP